MRQYRRGKRENLKEDPKKEKERERERGREREKHELSVLTQGFVTVVHAAVLMVLGHLQDSRSF